MLTPLSTKSSVSLWVRGLPRPEPLSYQILRERQVAGVRRWWAAERQVREARRVAACAAAADEIGQLNDREIIIAGAIAYWREGAKNKPDRRYDRVVFTNSDPGLSKLFLRFVDTAGVSRDRLIYRLVSSHRGREAEHPDRAEM